jgi:hypothetical protein
VYDVKVSFYQSIFAVFSDFQFHFCPTIEVGLSEVDLHYPDSRKPANAMYLNISYGFYFKGQPHQILAHDKR